MRKLTADQFWNQKFHKLDCPNDRVKLLVYGLFYKKKKPETRIEHLIAIIYNLRIYHILTNHGNKLQIYKKHNITSDFTLEERNRALMSYVETRSLYNQISSSDDEVEISVFAKPEGNRNTLKHRCEYLFERFESNYFKKM